MTNWSPSIISHLAELGGEMLLFHPFQPEDLRKQAIELLKGHGFTIVPAKVRTALRDDCKDMIAHDAAWQLEHAYAVLSMLREATPSDADLIRKVWMHAVHAGRRNASIQANATLRFRAESVSSKGGKAAKKLTTKKYAAALARGPKSQKQLAGWLGVSTVALRTFERREARLARYRALRERNRKNEAK
jgi:hypothetical protein